MDDDIFSNAVASRFTGQPEVDWRKAEFSGVIWPTVNRLIAGSSLDQDWYHVAFRVKIAMSVEKLGRIVASSPNLPDLAQRKDARRRDHAKSS
jgi:hypothetical protein